MLWYSTLLCLFLALSVNALTLERRTVPSPSNDCIDKIYDLSRVHKDLYQTLTQVTSPSQVSKLQDVERHLINVQNTFNAIDNFCFSNNLKFSATGFQAIKRALDDYKKNANDAVSLIINLPSLFKSNLAPLYRIKAMVPVWKDSVTNFITSLVKQSDLSDQKDLESFIVIMNYDMDNVVAVYFYT
ncbi:hypothetical protein BDB01DRAFT_830643 [Pilobolus umbonatus]|nr:hypothetical protein BDB01DRAFT_830643 [Pilobolus umbonatus]